MKTTLKEIVIFKAPAEDGDTTGEDAYKVTLEEAGITTYIVPVLTFEFFDLHRLRAKLQCPEEYSGLIFTSPRTVKAVALSLEGKTPSDLGWRNAYVVGETTNNFLQRELTMEGKGSNTGHAAALAEFILSVTALFLHLFLRNAGDRGNPPATAIPLWNTVSRTWR